MFFRYALQQMPTFFAFAKRWQKKRATYRETRCATHFSNKNLFRKGGLKKNTSTPKINQGCGSANDAVGQLAVPPSSNRRYPTSLKGARASEATIHAHVISASSASKNAALETIVPSVPCVPALSGTQKMYGFGFIASFAFVLRPPISAAAKASG
jgi:hypothetical protein